MYLSVIIWHILIPNLSRSKIFVLRSFSSLSINEIWAFQNPTGQTWSTKPAWRWGVCQWKNLLQNGSFHCLRMNLLQNDSILQTRRQNSSTRWFSFTSLFGHGLLVHDTGPSWYHLLEHRDALPFVLLS
jgi:hypothetical protein